MFSIFTPTNDLSFLIDAANSIVNQTYKNLEWVVLFNGDVQPTNPVIRQLTDLLVSHNLKISINYTNTKDNIGKLKKECCYLCTGDVLVELDHDDTLEPTCLQELYNTFKTDTVDFAYSDCYEYKDGESIRPFSEKFGWKYTADDIGRHIMHAFEPSPLSFGYIWFSPNHVRAWRRSFYIKIGGHDSSMDVCDDHELLIRTYINGSCVRIPKPLYNYHIRTGRNTCYGVKNKKIQTITRGLHDKYIDKLIDKWCDINHLSKIDLCCSYRKKEGYIGVDLHQLPGVDVVVDLDYKWPFDDGSVGVFHMRDAIEHLKDPIHTMKELHRCLAPNGWVLIEVPSTDGRGAFQDPTHVSFWNANSFWYYTKQAQARYIGTPVKFQLNRILDYFPSKWHKLHNIPYVKAHLVKLSDDKFIPPGGREI